MQQTIMHYNRPHTQQEIAEMQGCTFRAIQHVEERAIRKFIAGCEREAEAEGKDSFPGCTSETDKRGLRPGREWKRVRN